jgi:hypothetical protein
MTLSVANVSCVRAKIKSIFLSFQYVEITTVVSLSLARAQATVATLTRNVLLPLVLVRASHSCHNGVGTDFPPPALSAGIALRKQTDTSRDQIAGEAP